MPSDPLLDSSSIANPWQRLTRSIAYQNAWIVVYHDEVVRPDGQPGIYGLVHYRNRAVGVVAIDAADRVLLVGQYRYTLDVYSWEIPEGGTAEEEDLLSAARRELREETGTTAANWQEIARVHLSNSVSDEVAYCYLAQDLTPGPAEPEGTEQLHIRHVPFAEALAMTVDGRITDALSVIALQRVALRRMGGL